MPATTNEQKRMNKNSPKTGMFGAKSVFLLAAIVAQAVCFSGCAGVVARNSTTTPPPATAQLTVTPSTISFGNVASGTTNSQTVQVKNTGSASLTITQATITGTSFSESGMTVPMTLAAAQASSFTVKFAPPGSGSMNGVLTVTSDAPNSPVVVPLSGTGATTSLTLSVSPTSLPFGNQNVGTTSAVQDFKITNTGNANVAVSSIKSSGAGFAIASGGSAVSLTPTQSVTVGVQFAPTVSGGAAGSVSITSNATGSPATVTLSGTGLAVTSGSHTASLSWTPTTSTVTGYNVYRSTVSGGFYSQINGTLVAGTNYTDSTVQNTTTYFYVTTAVDSTGNESIYSNEAQAMIP